MADIRDDNSASRDSVFDWGFSRDNNSNKSKDDASASGNEGPSSRYDPKTMSRIVDITDLVDESSSEDSDDDAIVGHSNSNGNGNKGRNSMSSHQSKNKKNKKRHAQKKYGPGGTGPNLMCRQVVILVSLVMIIAAAGVAIGYAVIDGGDPTNNSGGASSGSNTSPAVRGADNAQVSQSLLEIAERVIIACAESKLDEDMRECQELCHASMCCFESGQYSCENDDSKDCAVYAGCEALVEGILLDGLEEDED